ncbi:imidazolonepropionase [Leclercia pneumoniae]|uniref:imidazolonepropionase n=1 Tax=Leclercia pneumoniae TaxID=2815358 RepID=UPI0021E5EDA4|nr:imidazolonepropionase [Leclercia pneumoniae]MCV2513180.1 imidazolonepropionase [Leclercia pneumoniae]WNN83307.1 imidazolonepropionase [Leclercia pneumoniae]
MLQLHPDDVILRNARLATLDPDKPSPYGLMEKQALILRGETILALIPDADLPAHLPGQHDIQGRLVTPGLIDCHTHLIFGGNRAAEWEQRLNGVSYQTISAQGGGINATVTATRDSTPEALFQLAQARLVRMMREGVTTLEIKSGYGLNDEAEEKLLRVAQRLAQHHPIEISPTLLAAHAVPQEYRQHPDGWIDHICQHTLPTLWRKQLFEAVDVFCETVGFTPAQTERLFQAAQRLGIPVKGHVEQLSNLGGTALVSRYHGWSADHIEYLDEAGVAAMAQSGTVAVLLPGAFYFLQERQRPPVERLRQHGVPMAVATDYNPGTSPFASLHLAMNMACVQFGLTPEEAWAGVTRNAAQALGRGSTQGQLKAGYKADLAIWDAESPVEMIYEPGRNPLWQRIFRGQIQ